MSDDRRLEAGDERKTLAYHSMVQECREWKENRTQADFNHEFLIDKTPAIR